MPAGLTGTESVLSAAIKAEVQANNTDFASKIGDDWDWLFDSIAKAVVTHVKDNLLVVGTAACSAGGGAFTHTNNS